MIYAKWISIGTFSICYILLTQLYAKTFADTLIISVSLILLSSICEAVGQTRPMFPPEEPEEDLDNEIFDSVQSKMFCSHMIRRNRIHDDDEDSDNI